MSSEKREGGMLFLSQSICDGPEGVSSWWEKGRRGTRRESGRGEGLTNLRHLHLEGNRLSDVVEPLALGRVDLLRLSVRTVVGLRRISSAQSSNRTKRTRRKKTHPKNNVTKLSVLRLDRRRVPAPRSNTDGLSIDHLSHNERASCVESDPLDLRRVNLRLAQDIAGRGGDAVPDYRRVKRSASASSAVRGEGDLAETHSGRKTARR